MRCRRTYDGSVDAFGLKLDPSKDGAAGIDYFTYLGTDGLQVAYGVDVDRSGNMYLAGYSSYDDSGSAGRPGAGQPGGKHGRFCDRLQRGIFDACRMSPPASTAARGHHRGLVGDVSPHR